MIGSGTTTSPEGGPPIAPAIVHLHIGSPKTGSTYLQQSIWDNRDALAAAGVLLPGDSSAVVQKAIGELLHWKPTEGGVPRAWRRLVRKINAGGGDRVLFSDEHLNAVTKDQWAVIVDSFPGARLEIVLAARDLARSVPAQWQSAVRQRYSWTLSEYASAVAAPGARREIEGPARHFWRRQDTPRILSRFIARTSLDQVRLVTVPRTGSDPDELWHRFSRACGFDDVPTTPGSVSNESLGAASAELMRRLNEHEAGQALTSADYKKGLNHALSRHALSPRRAAEPPLRLPDALADWAVSESARLVDEIAATGVEVVGDLDDLRSTPDSRPFVSPEGLSDSEVLDAALDGLVDLAAQHARLRAELAAATRAAAAATRAVAPGQEPSDRAT